MELRITQAANGWKLDVIDSIEVNMECSQDESSCVQTPTVSVVPYVFQYDQFDSGKSEVQSFAELLRYISDIIGPSTSRYDKERVYIEIKPGDKYTDIESIINTTNSESKGE